MTRDDENVNDDLDSLEIVKRFVNAVLYERDFEKAALYGHPARTIRQAPGLPYRGTYVGFEGHRQFREDVAAIWDFHAGLPEVEFFRVSDELVISRFTGIATLRATGRVVDFHVAEWQTVRDGLVVDGLPYYYDQAPLIEAGGLMGGRGPA